MCVSLCWMSGWSSTNRFGKRGSCFIVVGSRPVGDEAVSVLRPRRCRAHRSVAARRKDGGVVARAGSDYAVAHLKTAGALRTMSDVVIHVAHLRFTARFEE